MREVNIETLPLRHEVGLAWGASEVGELLADLIPVLAVDAVLVDLAVVHGYDLQLLLIGRKDHRRARKALLKLFQATAIRQHEERLHAKLLKRAVRELRLRDRQHAAHGQRAAPVRPRLKEGLDERAARAPGRHRYAQAPREVNL